MSTRSLFHLSLFFTITSLSLASPLTNIEKMKNSVVMIQSVSQAPDFVSPWKGRQFRQGIGSGLVIDNERILTNAHNVADAKYIIVKKQNSAQKYLAAVEFIGNDCDLATLKIIEPTGFFEKTFPLEIGELPQLHTTVTTYGFPVGGSQLSVTQGVVSRIQLDRYSHTGGDMHLVVQTDAAINPGNSGGPVMQEGKVVGIAFQGLTSADNIGYMIPTTVINHFLTDILDGKYDGFGTLGLSSFPGLHNKGYARYLNLPEDAQGVVVLKALLNSSIEGKLEKNDCLTKVAGHEIDNDGKIIIHDLRLGLSEAIEILQIGEEISFEFYRGGKLHTDTAQIAPENPVVNFSRIHDKKPKFYTYGGFVFVPITRNFLESWGNEWTKDIPSYLKFLFYHSTEINKNPLLEEYVVISKILPDEVNSYSEVFLNCAIDEVNSVKINSLADLALAIENNEKDFVEMRFRDKNQTMIIDANLAQANNASIMQTYNVTSKSNLED